MPTPPTFKVEAPSKASMPDVFSTVRVSQPPYFYRQLLRFVGPGFLISVGYTDPVTGRLA